jgi:hypothetical protein
MPSRIKLELRAHILFAIEERRKVTGDSNLGSSVERQIIARELAALADECRRDDQRKAAARATAHFHGR